MEEHSTAAKGDGAQAVAVQSKSSRWRFRGRMTTGARAQAKEPGLTKDGLERLYGRDKTSFLRNGEE